MKTNKSFSKRIRVTRNGKLMARHPGQDHFNAKESAGSKSAKKGHQSLTVTNAVRRRFLPGTPQAKG